MVRKTSTSPSQFDFDLICIGSGSGGGSAAVMAARKGLRVALIEGDVLGGEAPNYSSIPVSACLKAIHNLSVARTAGQSGIEITRMQPNWERVMAFKDRCVKKTGVLESAEAFEKAGIQLLRGFAQFVDPWTLHVDQEHITGRQIIIATGAKSYIPKISGLDDINYLTFKEALNLPELPSSVFIIGGGATGCSLAEIFHGLGSRVYLAEAAPNLLQREDSEVGQVEAEILKNKGINIFVNTTVKKITAKPNQQKEIVVLETSQKKNIIVDQIILATGKTPNVDLNLPAANVQFDIAGIKINRHLETSSAHIYAVGDVLGHDMLTHLAAYHSRVALHNLLHEKTKDKMTLNYNAITRYIPLTPAVAAVGLTETELRARQVPYRKALVPLHNLDQGYLNQEAAGFVKLISSADKKYLIGGSVIAPEAAEMIAQLALVINARISVETFLNTIRAFATWSEAFALACQKLK